MSGCTEQPTDRPSGSPWVRDGVGTFSVSFSFPVMRSIPFLMTRVVRRICIRRSFHGVFFSRLHIDREPGCICLRVVFINVALFEAICQQAPGEIAGIFCVEKLGMIPSGSGIECLRYRDVLTVCLNNGCWGYWLMLRLLVGCLSHGRDFKVKKKQQIKWIVVYKNHEHRNAIKIR